MRRRFMFTVSGFCMYVILHVLVRGIDTKPAEAAITMAFATLISITGCYVFGATWEDISTGGKASVLRNAKPRGSAKPEVESEGGEG